MREGIFGGSSAGTLLAAALRYCREQTEPRRVVTIVPDAGGKYLSKMFNDFWLAEQGVLERERKGDLSDLIARRHGEKATVTIAPDDSLHDRARADEALRLSAASRARRRAAWSASSTSRIS